MNKQISTEAITLGPVDDLTQQIESGKPLEEVTLFLPGGHVCRSLTTDEIALINANISNVKRRQEPRIVIPEKSVISRKVADIILAAVNKYEQEN